MIKRIPKGISNIVLTSILAVTMLSACGNSATPTSQSEQKTPTTATESPIGNLKVVNIGFPSSGSDWADGALAVANEYGYLDEYLNPLGYSAKLNAFVGAAPAIHEALVSKDLDYVVYAGMAGVLGNANGIDTKLLAITKFTGNWRLIASTQSGIESIQDLKGKKIAYTRGASPHMYLIRVLNEAGYTFDDIEAINTTIPDGVTGVTTGNIDAAIVSAGMEAPLVDAGSAKVIHSGFDSDKNVYYEPSVLIGRTDAIAENNDVAVAIMKALKKGKR